MTAFCFNLQLDCFSICFSIGGSFRFRRIRLSLRCCWSRCGLRRRRDCLCFRSSCCLECVATTSARAFLPCGDRAGCCEVMTRLGGGTSCASSRTCIRLVSTPMHRALMVRHQIAAGGAAAASASATASAVASAAVAVAASAASAGAASASAAASSAAGAASAAASAGQLSGAS